MNRQQATAWLTGLLPGSQTTGLLSTGALTGTLSRMQRTFPRAKPAFDILADAVMNNSVQQQFNPASIDRFTREQLAAMKQVMDLATAQPATNAARLPARNLVLSTTGGEILVYATDPNDLPSIGDRVDKDGKPAPDGTYIVDATGNILTVTNGRISQMELAQTPTDRSRFNALAEARATVKASRKEEDDFNNQVARNIAARKAPRNQSQNK